MQIEQIRELRQKENFSLKPTPYLKSIFTNEFGEEKPIEVRNYQKIGIYSVLISPHFVLGDSTGLGKTLQVLSAIGYVWLKEPDYIPIVVTKKSALYQWEAETTKFMQNMRAVTVSGAPFERDAIYDKFFNCRNPDDKSLIILTYDQILKDGQVNVVKDRSVKPTKAQREELKELRKKLKEAKGKLAEQKAPFNAYMLSRPEPVRNYMVELLQPRDTAVAVKPPRDWTAHDQDVHDMIIQLRSHLRSCEDEVRHVDEEIAPPIVSQGIIGYMEQLREKDINAKFMIVFDEVHTLKNHKNKIHELCSKIADMSSRRVGMSATPVKNRLEEFYSIWKVIEPALFPKITHFYRDYCKIKMQKISGNRQIPLVVGHSNEQLAAFNARIEAYYLARQKHEVAKELPELITRELVCELSDDQEELYDMAELGLLNKTEEEIENPAVLLSSLIRLQQSCDAPQLIMDDDGNPFQGASSKIDAIVDLLENELSGTKTIIFSRLKEMINLIEARLKEHKIKNVRITGSEGKASVREKHKLIFQDMDSGVDVILITLAGSESINLQAAEHIICVDSPWSWGDYIQLIGRAIRIGSNNKAVVATHLMAMRQNGKQTMDHHVIKILRGKRRLADKVAGVSLKDGLKFTESEAAMELYHLLTTSMSKQDRLDLSERVKKIENRIRQASKKLPSDPVEKREESHVTLAGIDIDFS